MFNHVNRNAMYREGEAGGTAGTVQTAPPSTDVGGEKAELPKDSVANFSDMWKTETENKDGVASQNPVTPTVEAPVTKTSEEILNDHVKSLNLGGSIDMQQIMTDLNSGNSESMLAAIQSASADSYKAALTDANKMMKARIDEAVKTAVTEAGTNYKGDQLTQQMHERLPFTKDPAMSPVARGVIAQFIKKGASPDEALAQTENYFKMLAKNSAKDLGLAIPGNSRPGSGSYGNGAGVITDDAAEDESDWASIFNGI